MTRWRLLAPSSHRRLSILSMKLHADFGLPAIVHHDDLKYIPSPSNGVFRGMLDRDGDEVALATTLVRYAPNSSFPAHRHDAGEEFLVLEGTFADEHGAYPAGTYVRNPIGSVHAPRIGADGCLILVKLRWMVPQDTAVVVDTKAVKAPMDTIESGEIGDGGKYVVLYQSPVTTERVYSLTLRPGARVESLQGYEGGEEVFVVSGQVVALHDQTSTQLLPYSWLRLPPHTDAARPKTVFHNSGDTNAHVWLKTGHFERFVKQTSS